MICEIWIRITVDDILQSRRIYMWCTHCVDQKMYDLQCLPPIKITETHTRKVQSNVNEGEL